MNESYFFQNGEQSQGYKYIPCGSTVRKVAFDVNATANCAFGGTNIADFALSNNSAILNTFDIAVQREQEEYDIPYRPDAIAWAKYLLIEYFATASYQQCISNGFTPRVELNSFGYVKIVWYTKNKNITLTFKDNEVLFLIDDENNVIGDASSVDGLGRQFKNVERILKKYA